MSNHISVEGNCICRTHTSDSLLLNVHDDCPAHGNKICQRKLYDSEDGTFAGICRLPKRHRGEHEVNQTVLVALKAGKHD